MKLELVYTKKKLFYPANWLIFSTFFVPLVASELVVSVSGLASLGLMVAGTLENGLISTSKWAMVERSRNHKTYYMYYYTCTIITYMHIPDYATCTMYMYMYMYIHVVYYYTCTCTCIWDAKCAKNTYKCHICISSSDI